MSVEESLSQKCKNYNKNSERITRNDTVFFR